jgi:Rod binding domain-containing protein
MSLNLNVPLLGMDTAFTTSSSDGSGRLHKAAQDFEALLIGQMLKSAREEGSDGWLGSGEGTGDDSAMEMAESQLANALSSGGGIGLAKTIERAMSKNSGQNNADTQLAGSVASFPKNP